MEEVPLLQDFRLKSAIVCDRRRNDLPDCSAAALTWRPMMPAIRGESPVGKKR